MDYTGFLVTGVILGGFAAWRVPGSGSQRLIRLFAGVIGALAGGVLFRFVSLEAVAGWILIIVTLITALFADGNDGLMEAFTKMAHFFGSVLSAAAGAFLLLWFLGKVNRPTDTPIQS